MRIVNDFITREVLFNEKFRTKDRTEATVSEKVGFGEVLKKAVNDTNEKLVESDTVTNAFIKGEDVNIDEVMIKNQEANLCLQFLTQTRDKLLEGYETLSKLQL